MGLLKRKPAPRRGLLRRLLTAVLFAVAAYLIACLAGLVLLRWVDPPFTAVHIQKRLESVFSNTAYVKRYEFVPLSRIGLNLQHAVIISEDGRFYDHHGIDWLEIEKVVREEIPEGRLRGVSTITQQLVKNLFMTTHRNPFRKPLEFLYAPAAEFILGKQRILELYLNVIEWGPGVYGAEAAARYHYQVSALNLTREQAARMAACIPSPIRYRPEIMNTTSATILARMSARGW